MIQVLPGASDEILTKLEQRLAKLPLVSEMMRQGKTPEAILETIFPDTEVEFLERQPVAFKCDCSKERFAEALASLPQADIDDMIAKDHGAQAVCHFCGAKYDYSEADLKQIMKEARA